MAKLTDYKAPFAALYVGNLVYDAWRVVDADGRHVLSLAEPDAELAKEVAEVCSLVHERGTRRGNRGSGG